MIAIAAITIAVIRIAVDAVNMCVSSMAPQKLPLVYANSSTNITKPILNRLLPRSPAIANFGTPSLTAAIDEANSGSDVLKATNWVPTKLVSQSSTWAIFSAANDKKIAVMTIIDAEIR